MKRLKVQKLKKLKRRWGWLVVAAVIALTTMAPVPIISAKEHCENNMGGIWMGSTPDESGGECWVNDPATLSSVGCAPDQYAAWIHKSFGAWNLLKDPSSCRDWEAPINYGMRRKGVCKLMDIDDGYLGGYVTATVKGAPSVLKLKTDGKTYSLPVVPGSVVANGDGTYSAQFYTLDPVTGQALVPAGEYTARCHGAKGSKDGGSANTLTIGY